MKGREFIGLRIKRRLENICESITIEKRAVELTVLVVFLALFCLYCENIQYTEETSEEESLVEDSILPEKYSMLHSTYDKEEQEDIKNEIFYGELEEVALLVQAEAGNQDELGKRYVADVIWNRVDTDEFPDAVREVIYQMDPVQFSTTINGAIGAAGYTITDDVFQIALEEYSNRTNSDILYFRTDRYGSGTPAFKYGAHYFSTK